MITLRRYLWREVASSTGFVLLALVALFAMFDLIKEFDDVGHGGYRTAYALAFVLLLTPSRTYELMPIAALIGTVYALSKLAANSEFTIMRVAGLSTRRLASAIVQIGIGFVVLTYVLGESLAPSAEDLARRLKLEATGASLAQEFRSGVWVRDVVADGGDGQPRLRFVNVNHVNTDTSVVRWRIYEFDRDMRLRTIATADSGSYVHGQGWNLQGVVETSLPPVVASDTSQTAEHTEVIREPQMLWRSGLTPEIFGAILVQPERMSALNLSRYIRHLDENHQVTNRFEIALWGKLFYPLTILVMMALALPFAYLHVRSGTMSFKVFSGIMIGVIFYAMNKLFSHLGLLATWPPIVVAALPGILVLAVALTALYWVERR
ncbi:MAG: LPS export ABC transporter permease LptG [Burkholderiaceae bacterium]|nr:LPS export ABC transporter permease LptG [Burkholderiaceae bacterium]